MTVELVHAVVASPVGDLTLVASPTGVRHVRFGADAGTGGGDVSHPLLAEVARQLGEYFAGERRAFDVPLEPQGTPFQRAAWAALTAIPYGETVSYGEQARRVGMPGRARAIGSANGANPIAVIVPCHRVVGHDGRLVGFGGGLEAKAWLLHHERRIVGVELPL